MPDLAGAFALITEKVTHAIACGMPTRSSYEPLRSSCRSVTRKVLARHWDNRAKRSRSADATS